MGALDRLFGRAAGVNLPPPTTPTGPTIGAPTMVPYLTGATALGLSAVWRCVTLIADAIADLPWQELAGSDEAPEPLPLSRIVKRPYSLMTRREWTWRVVATEALYNTAYLLHVGGTDSDGVPWSLMPIPPLAILPLSPPDPWGLTQPIEYLVGGQRVAVDYITVIRRSPFPGFYDRVTGILELARAQFQTYVAADTHLQRYWINGGPVLTQIKTDQQLTDGEAETIAQRWVTRRSAGNDYPAVMGKGAEAQPFGADPTTDSAVDARREMVADIGRYFGVPSRILNAPAGDSETYANVENDASDLWRYTLRGYAGPIEDAVSDVLPGDYLTGRRMRLDPTRYLQGDLQSRAQAYPMLVAAGIFTKNEARAKGFALPPLDADELGAAPPESSAAAVAADDATPTPAPAIPAAFATVGGTP